MEMQTIATLSLVAAVFAQLAANFFKSPKEASGELTLRVSSLEAAHHALAVQFAASSSILSEQYKQHDDALDRLTEAVKELTSKFDKLSERLEWRNAARQA